MKFMRQFVIILLIYLFLPLFGTNVQAIIPPDQCSSFCNDVINAGANIATNSIKEDDVRITYSETQKKFTIVYSYTGVNSVPPGSSLCGVFGQKSDPNQNPDEVPIIACKKVEIAAGRNTTSVDFTLDDNETPTAGVYTFRLTDSEIRGPEIAKYNLTVSNNVPLPIASPTPEPGEDCIGQFQSFGFAGTCCDPGKTAEINGEVVQVLEVDGKTKPYCAGYQCEAIPDDYLEEENFVCNAENEKGWVQPIVYEQDTDDVRKAIEQATQDCGRIGLQCCLPKLLEPPTIDHWWFRRVLNPMLDWISNLVGVKSMVGDIESELNSATDGTICKETGAVPELTYTDDKKEIVDNVFFTGNEKDGVDAHYQLTPLSIRSFDQCIKDNESTGREDKCTGMSLTPTIIPLPPQSIPENKVESCACVAADGSTNNKYLPDAATPRNINEDELKKQLCALNGECQQCEEGSYWQSWLDDGLPNGKDGKCVPESEAIQNLDILINNAATPTPATTSRSGESAVLAGEADIDTYVKGCQSLSNPWRQFCKACRLDRGFWGAWGCYPDYVDVGHIINLCRNLDDPVERGACTNCTGSGRMWTAIGCVDFNIQGIIQEQVFGWGIGLAGISAILCIIYSAFILQTSANNPEKIKQAQDTMTACITGLVVIIFSVFILNVIGVDILRIPGFTREPTASTTGTLTPVVTPPASAGAPTVPITTPLAPTAVIVEINSPTPVAPTSPLGTPSPTPTADLTGTPTSVPTVIAPTKPLPTPTPTRSPVLAEYDCEPREKPPDDEVYLYSDINYGGKCLRLEVGDYGNLASVKNSSTPSGWNSGGECNGSFNDCIESFKVGKTVSVTIYQHAGGEGGWLRNLGCSIKERFDVDDLTDLKKNGCENNSISAVKVTKE